MESLKLLSDRMFFMVAIYWYWFEVNQKIHAIKIFNITSKIEAYALRNGRRYLTYQDQEIGVGFVFVQIHWVSAHLKISIAGIKPT